VSPGGQQARPADIVSCLSHLMLFSSLSLARQGSGNVWPEKQIGKKSRTRRIATSTTTSKRAFSSRRSKARCVRSQWRVLHSSSRAWRSTVRAWKQSRVRFLEIPKRSKRLTCGAEHNRMAQVTGSFISAVRDACRNGLLDWSPRLMLAMYECDIQASSKSLQIIVALVRLSYPIQRMSLERSMESSLAGAAV
jgi:hypothetical protein